MSDFDPEPTPLLLAAVTVAAVLAAILGLVWSTVGILRAWMG